MEYLGYNCCHSTADVSSNKFFGPTKGHKSSSGAHLLLTPRFGNGLPTNENFTNRQWFLHRLQKPQQRDGLEGPTRSHMSTCKLCPPGLEGCHLCCESGPHHYVPQRRYVSRQGAWMEGVFEPKKITFWKENQCGIPVKDAVLKYFKGLTKRDS